MKKVLDLFSGIGGISLGLERAGMRTVAFCEIEPFQRAVLKKHWPEVPCYEDIRKLSGDILRRDGIDEIGIIAGGFPCQDISCAGKGAGIEKGEQSGLWREMFRLIQELMPRWVLAENVPALRTRGADRVISDLEATGYTVWPLVVGAWAIGAPHKRDRVWIVACAKEVADRNKSRQFWVGRAQRNSEEAGVENSSGHQLNGCSKTMVQHPTQQKYYKWPARPDEHQHAWEEARLKWPVGSATDGIPERLVRFANRHTLAAAGNSVVPQVVEALGRAIMFCESCAAEEEENENL